MVKSKKRIKKSIESFEKQIERHKDKIAEYSGEKDYLISYWEKEITTFEKEKKKAEKKLKEEQLKE